MEAPSPLGHPHRIHIDIENRYHLIPWVGGNGESSQNIKEDANIRHSNWGVGKKNQVFLVGHLHFQFRKATLAQQRPYITCLGPIEVNEPLDQACMFPDLGP